MTVTTLCRCGVLGVAGLLVESLGAAPEPPANVRFCVDVEHLGTPFGLTARAVADAGAGAVVSLDGDAWVGWGLRLPAGTYTFVFRAFAPAGDQDALFVTIADRRQRFTVPIGRWGQCAMGFTVAAEGTVPFQFDGQEAGVQLDRCAVVDGTVAPDAVNLVSVPATPAARVLPASVMPRLERPCRLAEFPPLGNPADTAVLRQDFEVPLRQGVYGRHETGSGPWGQHLVLGLPDGRLEVPLDGVRQLGNTGTVEWWVRPRPTLNAWRDQGWRYFLHGTPAAETGIRLDLSRHVATGLTLSLTGPAGTPRQSAAIDTGALDPEAWHHLLVSWDSRGDTPTLWLLVDGKGRQKQFQKGFGECGFQRLVFGNSPPDDGLPFLCMDGALDRITVSRDSVQARLVP